MGLDSLQDWLAEALPVCAERHRVPGAVVAVGAGDQLAQAATGVLSTATGVGATTDSVFQVGSITKVLTATLVMQLADDGLIDLDAPILSYLPDFRLADSAATARVSVRHLLCHAGGFEGDIFIDTGRSDDAVMRLVDALAEVPQLFPPGTMYSYCNAGFVVLGRLVEVFREQPYAAALRERIAAPLGLSHLATSADEAIMYRAAVGHLSAGTDEPSPAPVWSLAASNAPAGSLLSMRAADLVAFARMHLAGGLGSDGARVLSEVSVGAMQQPQRDKPDLGFPRQACGLGWHLDTWSGTTVIGHDGDTIGQSAVLRVLPESGVVFVLLTNGGDAWSVYRELCDRVLAELTDLRLPPAPVPPEHPVPIDGRRVCGRYESRVTRLEVSADSGKLWLTETPLGEVAGLEPPSRVEVVARDAHSIIAVEPQNGRHVVRAFFGADETGRARFMHTGRATARAA